MNKFAYTGLTAAIAGALLLTSCATYTGQTSDPNDPNRTGRGAAIGAVAGAVLGAASGGDATERRQRATVGAAAGAAIGAGVGVYQDRQEAALRRQMAGTGVEVERQGDNITLNMPSGITFDFDRADLKSEFRPVLDNLATTLNEYNQTRIEVTGHTDSKGTDAYNMTLSQNRANAVAGYLGSRGVASSRMVVSGAGETRPVASNDTESGRAQNRRVEITLVPMQG
jgi:outer membrane protein OmpA-like peptidoglycan-associated protein